MLWSVLGSVCLLTVLTLVVVVGTLVLRLYGLEAARAVKLQREGRVVKAWIVFGHDQLFQGITHPDSQVPAVVVFTPQEGLPDLDRVLEDLAGAVSKCDADHYEDDDERIIGQVMRSKIGYDWPLRIPKRLTGGLEAYFVTVHATQKLLPKRRVTKPYVYCKVHVGRHREDRAARMVAYPKNDPG
jgi:hypothetical protein